MCLAIPGKVTEIMDYGDPILKEAKVSFDGIQQKVNLSLVPDAKKGDYVLVHVGVAIGIVDEEEAEEIFKALKSLGEYPEQGN
jgi:hydrogenase expression/formation protein HypC